MPGATPTPTTLAGGAWSGWLLTITRNLSIDSVRVRRPTAFDPAVIVGLDRESDERGPADLAGSGTTPNGCASRWLGFPRNSVGRSCWPDCSATPRVEIGEIEDIPLGTAKTRIRTALQRLRLALVSEERAE